MIVGTLTLLAVLFGSGSFDLFFIHDFEKSVKEIILDKDRSNDILADLKEAKSIAKAFEKQRKTNLKEFKTLNTSRATSDEDFKAYFTKIHTQRVEYQTEIIDIRIITNAKIELAEWNSILEYSKSSFEKEIAKAQRKSEKKKEKPVEPPFTKTKEVLSEKITDSEKGLEVKTQLDNLINVMSKLQKDISGTFEEDKVIIIKKDATKSELHYVVEDINQIRSSFFNELVSFHFVLKENTNEDEWQPIIKSFNKELHLLEK